MVGRGVFGEGEFRRGLGILESWVVFDYSLARVRFIGVKLGSLEKVGLGSFGGYLGCYFFV